MSTHEQPGWLSAEELFRRYMPAVARFLAHLGVAPSDLEDVLQDVFVVTHARGGYSPGPAKPMSYLGSIAVRAAASHRRKRRNQWMRHADDALESLEAPLATPGERFEQREALAHARAALERLDPELRAIFLLVDVEGESCLSVAASMQLPVGTVYSRLHRARGLFQKAAEQSPPVVRQPLTVAQGSSHD